MVKLTPVFRPRRSTSAVRFALFAAILITLFYYLDFADPPTHSSSSEQQQQVPIDRTKGPGTHGGRPPTGSATGSHPIDKLIGDADKRFDDLLSRRSETVGAAAEAYRARRGRHPPPGFETWFDFAKDKKSVIVEDFFDQIYHDMEPFWGMDPAYMRKEAASDEMHISVRNGHANTTSDWFWTLIWLDMFRTIDHMLPDMDIALNPMDEPRIILPYEDMEKMMEDAARTRSMPRPHDVVGNYQSLPKEKNLEPHVKTKKKNWEKTEPYWRLAQRGCAPDSPARTEPIQYDFSKSPDITLKWAQSHMHQGFVSNTTLARDICHQPDLQGLSGIFIEPLSTSTTKTIYPMFGGSKLSVNNEIILPAAMYWEGDDRFTGGDDHGGRWADKRAGTVWRGVATGGRNRETNWKGFQRHRFVSMNNATEVFAAEHKLWKPQTFGLPDKIYNLAAQAAGKMAEWVGTWSNAGFTDLMCEPNEDAGQCTYTAPYYYLTEALTMWQQFEYKYLPDVDGNSYSGRYLGFLRSTSLPIKATLWREWHDDRLVAWKHYVPMDSRLTDYYGIMQYFLGYDGGGNKAKAVPGHDAQAEKMAMAGKEWAEKVLRKEDMQVYTLRLLLEYARVVDERREKLGWVKDLMTESVGST